jgi:hypothetical protein
MKKVIINCFLILLAISANAQLKFGAKAGLNYSTLSYNLEGEDLDEDLETPSGIGYHAGVYLKKSFSDKIGLQPELVVSMRTLSESEDGAKYEETYTYIDIPVMLDYNLSEKLSLQVGPQLSLLGAHKWKYTYDGETESESSTEGLNSMNFCLAVGGTFDTGNGLNFGVRYQRGLNSIYEDIEGLTVNWNVVQLSVGYSFIK